MLTLNKILISRRYLVEEPCTKMSEKERAWLNTYLFANFGIIVDQPDKLTLEMVKAISDEYKLKVPKSFYKNPQDIKFYTRDELFLEQVVSYFLAYGADDSHVKLFEKDLPEYFIGPEVKVREFCILSTEYVDEVFYHICKNLAAYKRPWNVDEISEFTTLYNNGFYSFEEMPMLCGDNAVVMLDFDPNFAQFLFKKDVVKLSVARVGENKNLRLDAKTTKLIRDIIPIVKDCPLSKKQAKYFNKLIQITGAKVAKVDNKQSPNRLALQKMKVNDILGAAEIFAKNGSLLERNLKFLLSRANPVEAVKILDMLSDKNPVILYQLMSTIMADTEEARTFSFYAKNKIRTHIETIYEARWRKSRLNEGTKKLVHDTCFSKIENHYKNTESLGKVYIDSNFYKVAVPVNTSASGKGIDVPPVGTRLPIKGSAIRTFVHWENAFDIDSSVVIQHENGELDCINFTNYSGKPYGNAILFSGDVTSRTGTEYFDIKLDGVRKRGVKRIVFTFHGFNTALDTGEIYCGYQNKENLDTKAWDPKNIELKLHVKGDKRAYVGFCIDLETNEIVIINLMRDSDSRIVAKKDFTTIEAFIDPAKLELNMGLIASWRGEVVSSPEEADTVFADDYKPSENQQVIRSFDIEKLVSIAGV